MKQASKWYLKFDEVVTSMGFKENKVDHCIYLKHSGSKFIFLVLYVDDILLASNDLDMLHETKHMLMRSFGIKDPGEASFVLGIHIHRDRSFHTLGLSQKAYINRVLECSICRNVNLEMFQLSNMTNSTRTNVPRMRLSKQR